MSYRVPDTLRLSLDLLGGVPVVPVDRPSPRERRSRFKTRRKGKPGSKRSGVSR